MTIYLAIDDTDNTESPGTGNLARRIAELIGVKYAVLGVTRHQLCDHADIPMTSHNSCAVLHIANGVPGIEKDVYNIARKMVLARMAEGSDPGIAVASANLITPEIGEFGEAAKVSVVGQDRARQIASDAGIILEGLGGTEDGVIGAVAGVGLAAMKNDGRFVIKDSLRDLHGVQPVPVLLSSGVDRIINVPSGESVTEGEISLRKFAKPALVNGEAVLYVSNADGGYVDLKRG